MKLSKRIKQIATLTVDDFYNSGKSTSESKENLISWLCDDMLNIENIEDLYTYEISFKVLDKLKSLDIVDLGFIIELICTKEEPRDTSITFDEVVL